ncbi:1,2-phenylacetyl-CoA epoxidase subunit PaaD [Roseomonas sp. AR75]|uniref:1,2-phenylacetyl-CoA epoxidase subunit PaaD n=1 Tax=Roseomonas sp. AR75 TaxID=2562311 RepID=UPI001F0FB2AD|nr:1,2-phenylacetyl-CoA epoxidase subunit PaaD [Roseomonas sp. AR75]
MAMSQDPSIPAPHRSLPPPRAGEGWGGGSATAGNADHRRTTALAIAGEIPDPEIPVLTIADLGVLRDARVDEHGAVEIDITPTYSGCPAMSMIALNIETALAEHGIAARVKLVLSPAWTTDWMTQSGRDRLREYGIAPPAPKASRRALFGMDEDIACPRCGSTSTEKLSEFGSTACKALWRCTACREPFDHFKCL